MGRIYSFVVLVSLSVLIVLITVPTMYRSKGGMSIGGAKNIDGVIGYMATKMSAYTATAILQYTDHHQC